MHAKSWSGLILLLVFLAGCVGQDRLRMTEITVEREGADFVEVELLLSTGNMTLTSGAASLFVGEFTRLFNDYEPIIEYEVDEGRGHLVVEQPSNAADTEDGTHYITDLELGSGIPLDLTLEKNEGSSEIRLTDLTMNNLSATLGINNTLLEVAGEYPTLTTAAIAAEQGEDEITFDGRFPSLLDLSITTADIGDTVSITGSFETLTTLMTQMGNDDDLLTVTGTYPTVDEFRLMTGGGDDLITVFGGFNTASELIIDVGIGNDVVDLGGAWTQNANITIISEDDSTTLRLPDDVGVRVEVASRSAEIDVDGNPVEGTVYTNDLYDSAEVNLNIQLNTASGEVINLFSLETGTQ
jgi:hypothetical protein